MGAAAYGAQYDKDDTVLAYTLTTAQPDGAGGTATSLSSGSSEIIKGDQDIDSFTARFEESTEQIHFGGFIYGTPEELAAVGMGPLPQPGDPETAPAVSGDTNRNAADPASALFDKLQRKQAASDRLVGLLQSFVDAINGRSKRDGDPVAGTKPAEASAESATHSRLAQFTGTDVTT
jgi:hypothetical protein